MKDNIVEILITAIGEASKGLGLRELPAGEILIDIPQNERFGDFSTNCALRLSKELKKSPSEVALKLSEALQKYLQAHNLIDVINEVKVEGAGFINFYLSDSYLCEEIKQLILKKEDYLKGALSDPDARFRSIGTPTPDGKLERRSRRKVLIEFVSANPTGPLSVAHARQAVVGDVLGNILDFLGLKVTREYYLNDEGNQINILTDSVALRLKELEGVVVEYPENYYQGDYIKEIAREVKSKKLKVKNLEEYVVTYILDIIKKELDDFGVKFDNWYSQKELRQSGKIDKALDFLKNKGLLYEEDGAVWFRSTDFGDDKPRVVIKSDKSYTYLAPDIAYHQDKYARGFDWLINLWGPDHHGYIGRLKAAVQALGERPESLSIIIVQLASIFRDGKSVEMSTRKGQYITLREVLDEVGRDAARFFFLMRRTSAHLDFDLELAKKQTSENPVYYVQYAYARICSILRSSEVKPNPKSAPLNLLKEKEEKTLIKKSLQFSYVLDICLKTEDPYMLTVYLQELSEDFHKFYDLHRVLGEDKSLTQARLALLEAAKTVIAQGLKLLGISLPERM